MASTHPTQPAGRNNNHRSTGCHWHGFSSSSWRVVAISPLPVKKGRRTDAARPAPTKGQYRTAWPTPRLAGRGPMLLLIFKSPEAQVGRFGRSRWTLARRSNCLIAAHRHGGRYPLCQMSSGRLSVARRQRTAEPAFAGWENPRRKIGSIQGPLGRRFATRSAVPMPLCYQ